MILLAAAVLAGSPLPVVAPSTAPLTLAVVERRFSELDAKMGSLKASFRQTVRIEGSDTAQTVEGEVLFKKPDLLRLTHRVPERQTVVSDGAWLWVHRESTNQVIKTRLDAWRKSEPLAKGLLDFGRSAELLSRYDASISTVSAPDAEGHRRFELALKPKAAERGAQDFTLTLKASTKDFFPSQAVLVVGRASVSSRFEEPRLNPELPADAFRFAPPPGADVFETPQDKP